jgi:ADP-ribose pyrophosphatase YjhB (NUDIX family)
VSEFSVAGYAVIQDDRERVLLTRRREGDEWVLPGGSVETGEPPWEAVVREVFEETGLEVEVARLVGVYVKRRETDLVLAFEASIVGGELRNSDERDAVEFFPPDRLPDETSGQDRERIDDARTGGRRPVLRVQRSQGDEPPPGTR